MMEVAHVASPSGFLWVVRCYVYNVVYYYAAIISMYGNRIQMSIHSFIRLKHCHVPYL